MVMTSADGPDESTPEKVRKPRGTEELEAMLRKHIPAAFSEGEFAPEKILEYLGKRETKSQSERYEFNWAGKQNALQEIRNATVRTLKPDFQQSINYEDTNNMFIEGDNLEVLKIIQRAYNERVDLIYIDPPYNTGNDFVYKDDFRDSVEDYEIETGQREQGGGKLVANPESNGRFHSDWLTMMYSRLFIARKLLTEQGVAFVSIGEDELSNLTRLMDEVFGEENRIRVVSRVTKKGGNKGSFFSPSVDYILVYAKNKNQTDGFSMPKDEEYKKRFKYEDEQGRYNLKNLYKPALDDRPNQKYSIECPDGEIIKIPDGGGIFSWSKKRFDEEMEKGNVVLKKSDQTPLVTESGDQASWNVYKKYYLADTSPLPSNYIEDIPNSKSKAELEELGVEFQYAKPVELIKYLIELSFSHDSGITVLDFFAGSGTTAQAVMEMNAEDGGSRSFILVQLPEAVENEPYSTICELSFERIQRAFNHVKDGADHPESVTGSKYLRVANSNFPKWDTTKTVREVEHQTSLYTSWEFDGSEEDALVEILLLEGFTPNAKVISETTNSESEYYYVQEDGRERLVTFSDSVELEDLDKIGLGSGVPVVCLDSRLSDTQKDNIARQYILKTI